MSNGSSVYRSFVQNIPFTTLNDHERKITLLLIYRVIVLQFCITFILTTYIILYLDQSRYNYSLICYFYFLNR